MVVKAIRANKTCMKGLILNPSTRRGSVVVETPLNAVELSSQPTSFSTYLTPGGDYLFLVNPPKGYLQVFDVKTSNVIWTYSNLERDIHMVELCLEASPDGLPVFLLVSRNGDCTKMLIYHVTLCNSVF